MNRQDAAQFAREQLARYAPDWSFGWSTRKRAYGHVNYTRKVLYLSGPLTDVNDEARVKDTVLHEIAHILAGPAAKHGHAWKLQAIALGADPSSQHEGTAVAGSWQAVCVNGHVHYRHRKPKAGRRTACGKCSRRFDERYVLNFERIMEAA